MKKIVFLLFVLILAGPVFAQESKNYAGIGAGVAIPTNDTGEKLFEKTLEWGKPGLAVDFQYLRKINDYFSLGLELTYSSLSENTVNFSYGSADTSTDLFGFFVASRVMLTPHSRTRVYIPWGIGVTNADVDFTISATAGGQTRYWDKNYSDTGLAGYIGLGVELARTDTTLLSLEGRYNTAKVKDRGISTHLNYVSVALKVGGLF